MFMVRFKIVKSFKSVVGLVSRSVFFLYFGLSVKKNLNRSERFGLRFITKIVRIKPDRNARVTCVCVVL
jgi:hypothetical protein